MPGSLLNLNRKVKRHDSTRSDISTYSNDSKKKVSFNKAVRVKKFTNSEDEDKNPEGKKFWFRVYKDIDPDIWREYSGEEEKSYSDDKLKPIDESSVVNHVVEQPDRKNIRDIINKFNRQAIDGDDEDEAGANDTLNKYKRNSILNGMKAFFNSGSLRNKKGSGSVNERNLENLFRSGSYDGLIENDRKNNTKVDRIPEEWWPEKYEGNLRKATEQPSERKSNSVVEVKKWDSGDELIHETRQYDKATERTEKGELTKTVEERDQIWKNITRTITYAESSPKIIRKKKEEGPRWNEINSDHNKKAVQSHIYPVRRERALQYNNKSVSEPIIKNSDKYKVIRSKNGMVSTYSNPVSDKDKSKTNKARSSLDVNSICRPSVCSRDHDRNWHRSAEKRESNAVQKFKQEDKTRESKTEMPDYRRGYSTPRNSRRGSRTRSRDSAPSIGRVKITVNGEDIEDGNLRGGLATAFNNRQRARNSSNSPVGSGSGSDTESTHRHKTVILYIPGISHQQRRADHHEESGVSVLRSPSVKGRPPTKYRYYKNQLKEPTDRYSPDQFADHRRYTSN